LRAASRFACPRGEFAPLPVEAFALIAFGGLKFVFAAAAGVIGGGEGAVALERCGGQRVLVGGLDAFDGQRVERADFGDAALEVAAELRAFDIATAFEVA